MTTFDAPFFNLVIMNIRHSLLGLFLPLSLFSCHTVEKEAVGRPLSSYVNPFVGASTNTELAGASHGLGKTFPGATAPFGMVQVSPNTITGGDNGPGYSYEHTTIEGFAFTQMSGIGWYGDLGNFLVMLQSGICIHSPARKTSRKKDIVPGMTSRPKKLGRLLLCFSFRL